MVKLQSNSVPQLLDQSQRQDSKGKDVMVYHDSEVLLPLTDPSLAGTTRSLNNLREECIEYQCSTCRYKESIWKARSILGGSN